MSSKKPREPAPQKLVGDLLREKRRLLAKIEAQRLEVLREKEKMAEERVALEVKLRENLPHLHGFPMYKWSRTFFESTNRINLLCAANQISKSSINIRKMIHWATDKSLWPKLWPNRTPNQFWYLYPSKQVATVEFLHKFVKEFLPKIELKKDPVYGWKEEYDTQGFIESITFASGITCYFKFYTQNPQHLQTGTVDAIFCDEELPEHLWDELWLRLSATNGYFHMVFTATMNQELWRKAIEGEEEDESFPDALKLQVSKWDCLYYEDGSPSPWTPERIRVEEAGCKSETERLRRIEGRFVTEVGRKYPNFDPATHIIPMQAIPSNWLWLGVVDKGTGGPDKKNHFSAIIFFAVKPDFRKAIAVAGWRGDSENTTSGDLLEKYRQIRERLGIEQMWLQVYDYAAKDFHTLASRSGENFIMANKDHAIGTDAVNTMFAADMLFIMEGTEMSKLVSELMGLMVNTPKTKAKDDLADCLRYGTVAIPWDFNFANARIRDGKTKRIEKQIDETPKPVKRSREEEETAARRGERTDPPDDEPNWYGEIEFWNGQYG
jgi:hypothetical protein